MKSIKSLGMALALGAMAVGFSGCAGTRYGQSASEHSNDKLVSHRVTDSLQADTVYKFGDVNVATYTGTVQLSGFVQQRAQKERAGDLAKGVTGVKEVVNNITIKEN